jgi:7-cyano-7-deazaguanine synthase
VSLLTNFEERQKHDFHRTAVVVLSGGQDSITCLHLAKKFHSKVLAVSFNYGQRHAVELGAAAEVCRLQSIPHIQISLPNLGNLFTSALLAGQGDVGQPHAYLKDLPSSFVPCRNALMLTYAFGIAMEQGPDTCLYTGVCQTDYSGYPDCRQEFITSLRHTLNVGYQQNIPIITPLMFLNKAQTWGLAWEMGFEAFEDVVARSRTCYVASDMFHDWGHGCGECPACLLRKRGFYDWQRSLQVVL